MIVSLEDFLRRRSKISPVLRTRELAEAPGLREACRIRFGDDAEERFAEYFREHGDPTPASTPTAMAL